MSAACSNCRFWIDRECRRLPPLPFAGKAKGQWPVTDYNAWCGEHQPAREHVEEPE